jgi:hypothetical protein
MKPSLGQLELSAAAIATLALRVRAIDSIISKFQTLPYYYYPGFIAPLIFSPKRAALTAQNLPPT